MSWNVINVTPGYEQKIKNYIETSNDIKNINKKIFIPTIIQKEFINGKLHFGSEKLFPGYIFIECLDAEYDSLFSYLAGIVGILNMSSIKNVFRVSYKIEDEEMEKILDVIYGNKNNVVKTGRAFALNEKVKITSGPFSNFEGIVTEVSNPSEKETKVKVCTHLFNNELTYIIVSEFQLEHIVQKEKV